MEYRKLGNSGLTVSEISLGNWITHGAQVEDGIAEACVRTALMQVLPHLIPQMCTPIPRQNPC